MKIKNCCDPGPDEGTDNHFEIPFLGKRSEIIFSILSGIFLLIGFVSQIIAGHVSGLILVFYLISYFFGGFYSIIEAWENLKNRSFTIDSLMVIAAVGAAILGHWAEGALLLFLFSLGHALEHYAMDRARTAISDLGKITPKTALKWIDGSPVEVPVEDLEIGDEILVRPNTIIPADGIVVRGSGSVNQAALTGESIPVFKEPMESGYEPPMEFGDVPVKHRVFAGSLNDTSVFHVIVLKKSKDTTLARLVQLVSEAESQKSPTQLFAEKFQRIYVPAVLVLIILLHFAFLVIDEPFRDSFYRAMAVLVASSPCALAISTPAAVLSGVARAARSGVLIKGGGPLEILGMVSTIALDKTGTITTGQPVLVDVVAAPDVEEEWFLQVLGAVEGMSDHPLGDAIIKGIEERGVAIPYDRAADLTSLGGKGLEATFDGKRVWVGNKELFNQEGVRIPQDLLQEVNQMVRDGKSIAIAYFDGCFLGAVSMRDEPKPGTERVIASLHQLGVKNLIMLTGDHQKVGEAISKLIGLSEVHGNLLPEDKVRAVQELKREYGHVAMVGDGVNDAPAMAHSSVSIAMGAVGSDLALETADVALMNDELAGMPFVIALSRKSKQIIKQNLWISLGMVAILIPLTLFGIAHIGPAVVAHEGSTILVVFNALRLLRFQYEMK